MGLFDLLSIFYAVLGVRALWTLKQNWRAFTDDELSPFDRRLASELAFFVLVPIGVFLHELGHAAATYQMGGTIDWFGGGFHYALFFGYVIPRGRFTDLQDWWISLAGNLVSVIFGFALLLLTRVSNRAWFKYTMLASARIQLGWALVGYPLITFAGFEGDWQTIYFALPNLGVAVFIAQAILVIGLFLLDRSAWVKRWEVSLDTHARDELRKLDNAIAARPGTPDPIIERGNFFAAYGHAESAIAEYRAAAKLDPGNPRALYNIGQMRQMQKRYTDAEKYFREALPRAGNNAAGVHHSLALALFHRGKIADAMREFDAAIAQNPNVAEFFFWRGNARRAHRDDTGARSDFAHVLELAVDNPELVARAKELLNS
ncbi:MAG: tetratricopeptide repeat protein [Chloroflexi bacterium]|nr:tetratricopeptide repeat protein [Chloroflexota bacterium]